MERLEVQEEGEPVPASQASALCVHAAEETFQRLELSWEGDTLQVDAGHPVGADLWAGGTRRVIVGEGETMAIRPVDDRIGIFEDWLD